MYLSLPVAELRDLAAVRVAGVPGGGVAVEIPHQPRLVALLQVAVVVEHAHLDRVIDRYWCRYYLRWCSPRSGRR